MDPQLMEATNLLVECAFGKGDRLQIPARRAVVEVLVRENAFNPLFPQPHVQARDELLYVAFQQHIKIEVGSQAATCSLLRLHYFWDSIAMLAYRDKGKDAKAVAK